MKSKHLLAISLLGAASWLGAQNLDWYTYWGSDAAGSEITPRKIRVDRQGDIYAAATFGGTEVDIMGEKTASNSSVSNGDAVIVKLGADNQLIWIIYGIRKEKPHDGAGREREIPEFICAHDGIRIIKRTGMSFHVLKAHSCIGIENHNFIEAAVYGRCRHICRNLTLGFDNRYCGTSIFNAFIRKRISYALLTAHPGY